MYQLCINEELIYHSTTLLVLHRQAKYFSVSDMSLILTSKQINWTEFVFSELHILLVEINTLYGPSVITSAVITEELSDQAYSVNKEQFRRRNTLLTVVSRIYRVECTLYVHKLFIDCVAFNTHTLWRQPTLHVANNLVLNLVRKTPLPFSTPSCNFFRQPPQQRLNTFHTY